MIKAIPIFLTFLLMGVADAMGPLSSAVASNPFMAALMPFFVFIAFACFSVPGGLLAARIGKKNLLTLGLALCSVALAVPTFFEPPFPLLLASIFLLGIGTTFLQVSGNPIMRDVSRPGQYSRNLALAQGIKGVGSTASAYLVTAVTALSVFSSMGWRGAFPIFLAMTLITLVSLRPVKIMETKAEKPPKFADSLSLLREKPFALAVLGIFVYVGAEVCMTTFLKPLLQSGGWSENQAALFGPSFFLGAVTVGRLLAGSMKLSAQAFFRLSAALGLAGILLILSGLKFLLIPAIVVSGLGFANIWPMLFSITVERRPERASELSGLMCMAISGGALVPLIMARLGGGSAALPFTVPALCFAYLLAVSLQKKHQGA